MGKFTTTRNQNSPPIGGKARIVGPTGNHATGMSGSDFRRGFAPRAMPAATNNSPDGDYFGGGEKEGRGVKDNDYDGE